MDAKYQPLIISKLSDHAKGGRLYDSTRLDDALMEMRKRLKKAKQ